MEMNEGTRQAARTAIKKIAGTYNAEITDIIFATVQSVDKSARTCNVIPISGKSEAVMEGVALTIDRNDGEFKIPSVDSTVGVALSNQVDPFVFAWSDLDEIIWKGGNYDGLVRVKDLTDKLNNLENKVNDLLNAYNVHTHSVPGITVGVAAATSLIPTGPPVTPPLIPTQQIEIENNKITHGNS